MAGGGSVPEDADLVVDLERSIDIGAPADRVYALVSDLPRMPEWSPECVGVTWLRGARAPAVGARFVGRNKNGWRQWFTQGVVTAAEPGRRFRFDIHAGPMPVAVWEYVVTPRGAGCSLTERWTDRRPVRLRGTLDRMIGPRTEINDHGIGTTLERLKQAAER
jgi:uncharacterized protein YndB with AHSA1/START domain